MAYMHLGPVGVAAELYPVGEKFGRADVGKAQVVAEGGNGVSPGKVGWRRWRRHVDKARSRHGAVRVLAAAASLVGFDTVDELVARYQTGHIRIAVAAACPGTGHGRGGTDLNGRYAGSGCIHAAVYHELGFIVCVVIPAEIHPALV